MNIPDDLRYTRDHEWMDTVEGVATVGITQFATESLGDIVFLQLPTVGTRVTAGEPCGEIESTKSVTDLVSPVGGTVLEVNDVAVDDPAVVNSEPYGTGWLLRVRAEDQGTLLDAAGYRALIDDQP
jgi:glycine cleavage system H protein